MCVERLEISIFVGVVITFRLLYLIVFQTQTILSLLAEVDALHVIASIDHINAPLSK